MSFTEYCTESEKQNGCLVVSASVVYPHDHAAVWELHLAATAQHPKRVCTSCC